MALTKLDPTVIGQDSTGAGKITSAGGSVSIDSSGNVVVANTSANSVTVLSSGLVGVNVTNPSRPLEVKGSYATGTIMSKNISGHDFTSTGVPYTRALGIGVINHNSGTTRTSVPVYSDQWRNPYGAYVGSWVDIDGSTDGSSNLVGYMASMANSGQPGQGVIAYQGDLTSVSDTHAQRYGVYMNGEASNYFSGKVGIGVKQPSYLLEMSGSTTGVAGAIRHNGLIKHSISGSKPASTAVKLRVWVTNYTSGVLNFYYAHSNGGNFGAFITVFLNNSYGTIYTQVIASKLTSDLGTFTTTTVNGSSGGDGYYEITMIAGNSSPGAYVASVEGGGYGGFYFTTA